MAKYQLLAQDKSVVTAEVELTNEEVLTYAEDNELPGVYQFDSYDDDSDIFDKLTADGATGIHVLKAIVE